MNLGISHLAFNSNLQLKEVHAELRNLGINNLEIVFSKFKNKQELPNIPTLSTQSILYNSNITCFLDKNFLSYMETFTDKCCNMGIKTLVLGSPTCRNVFDLKKLIQNFSILDGILRNKKLILCIEPNAKKYQGKYFFNVDEIVAFINAGNFTNIKTMIDTHNLIEEQVNILDTLNNYLDKIYHIHISEKNLGPLIPSQSHVDFSNELKKLGYNNLITYEALNLIDITESTKKFTNIYGN
jgi:sugar phosphate isomerase/epimerase